MVLHGRDHVQRGPGALRESANRRGALAGAASGAGEASSALVVAVGFVLVLACGAAHTYGCMVDLILPASHGSEKPLDGEQKPGSAS